MNKHLHQIALGVTDLQAAADFYSTVLNLQEVKRFESPGLVFFTLSETRLLLEQAADTRPGSSVLYFEVDSIDEQYRRLSSVGVTFSSPPHLIHVDSAGDFGAPGSEEWMAFFTDPDGNHLAIVERRPSSSA